MLVVPWDHSFCLLSPFVMEERRRDRFAVFTPWIPAPSWTPRIGVLWTFFTHLLMHALHLPLCGVSAFFPISWTPPFLRTFVASPLPPVLSLLWTFWCCEFSSPSTNSTCLLVLCACLWVQSCAAALVTRIYFFSLVRLAIPTPAFFKATPSTKKFICWATPTVLVPFALHTGARTSLRNFRRNNHGRLLYTSRMKSRTFMVHSLPRSNFMLYNKSWVFFSKI